MSEELDLFLNLRRRFLPAFSELESELEDLDLCVAVPFISGPVLVISPSSTSSICSLGSSLELSPDKEISSSFSFSLTLLTLLTPERRSSSGFSTGSTAKSPKSWSTFNSESEISSVSWLRSWARAEAAAWIPDAETPGKLMKSGSSS